MALMKLHSEISIGWILLYACVLASLPGEDSSEKARPTINANISPKDSSMANNYRLITYPGDSSNVRSEAK